MTRDSVWSALRYLFLFFILSLGFLAPKVSAGRMTVSPAHIRLDLASQKPVSPITYTNNTTDEVQLTLSATDFHELEDGYKLSFLEGKDVQNYQYRLSSWISFDQNSLVLLPGQSGTVNIIVNADRLSPGAHYGTILASVQSDRSDAPVRIQEVIGTLIFVRTATGQEKISGSISEFASDSTLFEFPGRYILRLNNTGNVEIVPYGLVTVTDIFGRQVAKGVLNADSLLILPETIRRFSIPLVFSSRIILPGFYHARINLHFGPPEQYLDEQDYFFSLGNYPWVAALLILLLLLSPVLVVRTIRKSRPRPVTPGPAKKSSPKSKGE